ncbi:MAG TPA: S-layer homology domain-containing protein [Anaerolineales bacterium]|nr:S-layer homology domain-containing protein [Anaerolineales bacterium]
MSYTLYATATIDGNASKSPEVTVKATKTSGSWTVKFNQPTDQGAVSPNSTQTAQVQVIGPGGQDADYVDFFVDSLSKGRMTRKGAGVYELTWTSGPGGTPHRLSARAYQGGAKVGEKDITVNAAFDKPSISSPSPVDVNKTVEVRVTAPGAVFVSFAVSAGTFQPVAHTDPQDPVWRFNWTTPPAPGKISLTATAQYIGQPSQVAETVQVDVVDPNRNLLVVSLRPPEQPVRRNVASTVWVESPGPIKTFELHITDPSGKKTVQTHTFPSPCAAPCTSNVGFPWTPTQRGDHTLQAFGWDALGNKGWSSAVKVTVDPLGPTHPTQTIPINQYAFYMRISGMSNDPGDPYDQDVTDNIGVLATDYACGIVGYYSFGGDIEEEHGEWRIIHAALEEQSVDSKSYWFVRVNFKTGHDPFDLPYEDVPETWDVRILCVSRQIATIYDFPNARPQHLVNEDTGISIDQYACAIAGFSSGPGDINEKDVRDPIEVRLARSGSTWRVLAGFATHGDQKMDWTVRVLCIDRQYASLDAPSPGKPFFLQEFRGPSGTGLGVGLVDYDTGISTSNYLCGVAGFAARHGDIDEHDRGGNARLFIAYMDGSRETWRFQGDFRSEGVHEYWNDVSALCSAYGPIPGKAPALRRASPRAFDVPYGPGIRLTFSPPMEAPARGYLVQYSTDGKTWVDCNQSTQECVVDANNGLIDHHGSVTTGPFSRALPSGQIYYYKLAAVDGSGNQTWSNVISGTVEKWNQPPQITFDPPSPVVSPDFVSVEVTASDPNGDKPTLRMLDGAPDGARFELIDTGSSPIAKGMFTFSSDYQGQYTAWFQATDPQSLSSDPHPLTIVICQNEPCGFLASNFVDVPGGHWAFDYIEYLFENGYTAGTQTEPARLFSPERELNRAEMAVFLVRSLHPDEQGYVPLVPSAVIWQDPPLQYAAAFKGAAPAARETQGWEDKWTMELYEEGLTSGCSTYPPLYCPARPNLRAEMAVFALRTAHGSRYDPPAATQAIFRDVPLADGAGNVNWAARWIEQAYRDGLVQACQTDMAQMLYRPDDPITRAEAACMLYYALRAGSRMP